MSSNSAVALEKPQTPATPPLLNTSAVQVHNRRLLVWMFRFLRPVMGRAFLACFWLASWVGIEILAVRQTGKAVDYIQQLDATSGIGAEGFFDWIFGTDPRAQHLLHIIVILAGLISIMVIVRYLREVANMKMSMHMVYYIREAVYDKLQRVGFAFHDALSSGQLINRALGDLQNVRAFIQTAVLTTLEIVLIVGGYIALVLTRSPWVALLALVPLPFWTVYILRFGKKAQPVSKAVMEADDRSVSVLTESIAGVHVVKAFATERQEVAKYDAACDSFFARVMQRVRMSANFTPVIRTIAMASHLSLFLAAAILVIRGELNAGDFLILGSAMGAILGRLQQVGAISDQYQNAIVSARRLYEVLMAPPTVPEMPDARPLPEGVGHVRFDGVTFGYDKSKPVLHDLTFDIPGGSVVAIIGPTGAGKTTLVNLIARFYDPQRGRITIDDVDVRDVSLASLRTQVAFVFQETYLFSDTVEANIAYGRPGVSGGEVEAAARLAQAHEFIEQLPKGYKTVLSERGSSLSGGQRQRLAIARAILFDPRVLVLDDATAAVDPETEDLIRRGMKLVMHGRTVFVIAHRISTTKRADLVLVLEEGRITQMGTHDELMARPGHYREIAAAQLASGEELEEEAELGARGPAPEESPSHMKRVQDARELAQAVAARRKEPAEEQQEGVP